MIEVTDGASERQLFRRADKLAEPSASRVAPATMADIATYAVLVPAPSSALIQTGSRM